MTTVITGAAGFLGSHLVRHLRDRGYEDVVAVDSAGPTGSEDRMAMIRGDVRDLDFLVDLVRRCGAKEIVHLAYVLESPEEVHRQIDVNVTGTINVLEAARLGGVDRVVYASSVLVYPHRRTLDGPRLCEDDPAAPDGVYGACKLLGELAAERYARLYGLETIGLRFTAVFGPGRADRHDVAPDHNVLAELALRGQSVVMPPDDQLCDWMYVDDAVEVIRLALQTPGFRHCVLNVASECRPAGVITRAILELVPHAAVTVGESPAVTTSLMQTDRLRRELSFTPAFGVDRGLERCLETLRGES